LVVADILWSPKPKANAPTLPVPVLKAAYSPEIRYRARQEEEQQQQYFTAGFGAHFEKKLTELSRRQEEEAAESKRLAREAEESEELLFVEEVTKPEPETEGEIALRELPQIKALVNHPVLDKETMTHYALLAKRWINILDYGNGRTKPPADFTGHYIDYVGQLQRGDPTQRASIKAARQRYREYDPKTGPKTFVDRYKYLGKPPSLLLVEQDQLSLGK
jgi:hypothetical protein